MNGFKRVGALILALLLVAAPCVSVLADDENLGGVVTSNPDGLTSISFDVKSKSPKGHARPAIDITYRSLWLQTKKETPLTNAHVL